MTEISDELLMAYADGQIDAAARQRVEHYLASDPAGRDRLQAFIDTGPALARLLDDATARPIPAWLVDTVLRTKTVSVAGKKRSWSGVPDWLAGGGMLPMAVAASAALVIGGVTGWSLQGARIPSGGGVVVASKDGALRAGSALQHVLDAITSGQSHALDGILGGGLVTPVMSLHTRHAGLCRQYRLVPRATAPNGFEGLACRTADGGWRIEVHTPVVAAQKAGGRFVPASGAGTSLVDAAIDRLIVGDAIGAEEETSLIAKRWSLGGAAAPASEGKE